MMALSYLLFVEHSSSADANRPYCLLRESQPPFGIFLPFVPQGRNVINHSVGLLCLGESDRGTFVFHCSSHHIIILVLRYMIDYDNDFNAIIWYSYTSVLRVSSFRLAFYLRSEYVTYVYRFFYVRIIKISFQYDLHVWKSNKSTRKAFERDFVHGCSMFSINQSGRFIFGTRSQ